MKSLRMLIVACALLISSLGLTTAAALPVAGAAPAKIVIRCLWSEYEKHTCAPPCQPRRGRFCPMLYVR